MTLNRLAIALMLICLTVSGLTADTVDTVPDTSIVFVRVARMDSDPGVSWLSTSYLEADKESPLRDYMKSANYDEASIAVLPSASADDQRIVMIVSLKSVPDTALIQDTLGAGSAVKSSAAGGATIMTFTTPPESADFEAYAVVGNQVVLGSNTDAVRTALTNQTVTGSSGYQSMAGRVDTSNDGLLFADNENLRFADFLAPLEQKWQMTLLLSAMDLEWMASGFDVVDSERVNGTIVFKGQSSAAVPDIADDAEFLGETFRRKFVAEDIDYTSNVSVDGTVVTLDFTVTGLEPLWQRLFEQGVLSVIRPE